MALLGLQSENPPGDLQKTQRHALDDCSLAQTLKCIKMGCCVNTKMCDATRTHLVTDSSGDVANLHPSGLPDTDTSPAEVSDADIHP